jgi:5-methylcytosine-specific restriction enzyme subunit McrC
MPNHITLFEHETLRLGKGDKSLTPSQLKALQAYYGEQGVPYYSLLHNGVKFCEYVGVIQIGELTIEILPKADKAVHTEENQNSWRTKLIDMLRAVGNFDLHAPSSSQLQLKSNSILELYFELYLIELEYLLHRGLIKRYKQKEGNSLALKGSLQFAKHIQQNLVHQERFYVRQTSYSVEHRIHQILYKALKLLQRINRGAGLKSRIGSLVLNFPEMSDLKVTEATFEQIAYDRKNEHYQKALEIAKLLLLNYHPDLAGGQNHVLALMFDMNLLWEQFVYISLHKELKKIDKNIKVKPQNSKSFWKPSNGKASKLKPDILIHWGAVTLVLDTKWKNLYGRNPSPDDLRQMYVYHEYFAAQKVALLYPTSINSLRYGHYLPKDDRITQQMECSLMGIAVGTNIAAWQKEIAEQVLGWIGG